MIESYRYPKPPKRKSNCNSMTINDGAADGDTNPYLALRKQKIARNEARLRELGLLSKGDVSITTTTTRTGSSGETTTEVRSATATTTVVPTTTTASIAPRRSTRLRNSAPSLEMIHTSLVSVKSPVAAAALETRNKNGQKYRKRTISNCNNATTTGDGSSSSSQEIVSSQNFAPHSARSITLNIDLLLIPDILGKPMARCGKAYVMEESARIAAVPKYHPSAETTISFNKYSGVQEWANDVLFLWVNLQAPGSDVTNDFLEDGGCITWFGGSRMHDGTPVIQKLLQVGANNNYESHTGQSSGVVLWCRLYDHQHKTFQPYICLGRLSVRRRRINCGLGPCKKPIPIPI